MKCEKCGMELEENAVFCGNCGSKTAFDITNVVADSHNSEFVYPEIPMPSKTTVINKNRNLVLPLAICITIIVTICITLLATDWFKGGNDDNEISHTSDIQNEEIDARENDEDLVNTDSMTNEYELDFYESSDYIFPSDRDYLTKKQLEGLTKDEVALIRNEIYARHGYVFNSEEYKQYFASKSWYIPNDGFNENMFNPIEKSNKDLIVEYEIEMGWR